MIPLGRLLRWAVAPDKLEFLEGDLLELGSLRTSQGTVARWHHVRDLLSLCLTCSRFADSRWRVRLVVASLGLAAAVAITRSGDRAPVFTTLRASDPAGSFTLRFQDRQVVAATMNGVPVDRGRLQQRGNRLVIRGADQGRDFLIEVTAEGIRWQARQPSSD